MIRDAAIVRVVRDSAGLTQWEVGQAAAVPPKYKALSEVTIRRMERADEKMTLKTRARIAKALGLSFDWKTKSIVMPTNIDIDRVELRIEELHAIKNGRTAHDVLVSGPAKETLVEAQPDAQPPESGETREGKP